LFLIFECYATHFQRWYAYAKTLAEDAARKFLEEQDIKLIVINPAMTIGPLLQQQMNESCASILNLINGDVYLLNHSSLLVLSRKVNYAEEKLCCRFSQNNNSFTWLMQVLKRFPISALGGSMWKMLQMLMFKRMRVIQLVEDIVWLKELHTFPKLLRF